MKQVSATPAKVAISNPSSPLFVKRVQSPYVVQKAAVEVKIPKKYQPIVEKFGLNFERENKFIKIFSRRPAQSDRMEAARAKYWYRAMTEDSFSHLQSTGAIRIGSGFGGISTNANYSIGYMGNDSDANILVEFETPYDGYLYEMLTQLGANIKAEGDGGTFGLGQNGTSMHYHKSSALQQQIISGEINELTTGSFFNDLLETGIIKWRVVRLHIPQGKIR